MIRLFAAVAVPANLAEARHENDPTKIAAAQKAFDAINAKPTAHAG